MTSRFEDHLSALADAVEARLAVVLADAAGPGESRRPDRLTAAMRHAVLGGGKRLRPFLVAATAELHGGGDGDPLAVAAAVECLHCYSLVHDDLPSMDDDDLRRGRPTVHRAFDEATAILAGDGLQTLAFDLLADPATHPDAAVRIALVADLAKASGPGGMVGGQMLDLSAEGRFGDGRPAALGDGEIRRLQAMKTGALIRAACTMGARVAGAGPAEVARMARYGDIVGLAFQLADDLLDVTGDAATVGKATAKDAAAGKGTLVSLNGIAAVRAELDALVAEAGTVLAPYGARAETLIAAARFVADRER
ncbi:polyprenyl synthetase family protein [Oharaeibacter diazotrophicus]|uniref:Probable farnesyl diphosphate synthase n=1 Tax=Oharaeibacter diazotrophicus TaxID=1920512 RepID=A0A4R6RD93_9HYPH|nr:farnesyl diphosphate synthase [Oharaeibacter diazotrophicus]TDP84102.1 farnesyl-diphosphate synthase [Oharaeibacter diazotrophicus]BBE73141.1 farnesyl diphosphate synthase [Pleomorphomonas sp. SM30]GLS74930.1 (2E,6E)-farnesyl diphosphate synthase [Oharaeibacter diazotrophicus]